MPGLFEVDTGANADEHRDEPTVWRFLSVV